MTRQSLRGDGPYSAPDLLRRASPFIGAAVLAISLRDLGHLNSLRVASLLLSVFLIFSASSRLLWEALPRLVRPVPAALALGLSGLPIQGTPASNAAGYGVLILTIAVPFTMDAIPWGRVPRWGESVALLGSVGAMLFGRPTNEAADMLTLPIVIIVVLFIALYGNPLELISGVVIVSLQFLVPGPGEVLTAVDFVRGCILTSLAAIVAVCVHQVVSVMRRQHLTILEDHRAAEARETWINSVLENTADALVTIDRRGIILSLNRAAREMFLSQDATLIGRNMTSLVAAESRKAFDAHLAALARRTADNSEATVQEMTGVRGGGATFAAEYRVGEAEQDGQRVFIASLRDITDRKARSDFLEYHALHDGLTGLPNRVLLHDRLDRAIEHARRDGRCLAVMMVDVNHFKEFNDELGHDAGDRLLGEISSRMTATLRAADTVARLGGDEFVVLLDKVEDASAADLVAAKLVAATAAPILIGRQRMVAGISVGVAMYPAHGRTGDALLQYADQRMYVAKRASTVSPTRPNLAVAHRPTSVLSLPADLMT